MAEERRPGQGRGRRPRGPSPDAPGWNANASGGSHGAGGGYSRGGYSQGYTETPENEGRVHEGSYSTQQQGRGRGRKRGAWGDPRRDQPREPESWVGRSAGNEGGAGRGRERPTPYGTPQGWRSEDDYTLSERGRHGHERGPYTGRGPEGYTRSDDRIREDVCDRLTDHGGIDASGIRVDVSGGEVTLDGVVEERVEKWMAEEVADNVPGVRDVHNRIKLRRRSTGDAGK